MSRRTARAGVLLVAVLSAGAFLLPMWRPQQAAAQEGANFEETVRETFRQGMESYKRGHYKEAYEQLQKALEMQPDSSLVLALLEDAGRQVVYQMIREGFESPEKKDLRDTAFKILRLSEPAAEKVRKDQEVIRKYVEDLKSQDFDTQEIARFHLVNIGPYAIPELVKVLSD